MNTRTLPRRPVGSTLLGVILLASFASPAFAWKPKTHVWIASLAREDAIADGKITIYLLDENGDYLLDGLGRRRELGRYDIDGDVREALRVDGPKYFAGVVGPDSYPDTATGQMVIHPDISYPLLDGVRRLSNHGSDAWLRHLWDRMSSIQNPTTKRKALSFTLGYLTHAAGDMFAHSFVNYYTGGPFELPENGARHTVLEGYIGERTPPLSASASMEPKIDGLELWLYYTLIRANPDSDLDRRLLVTSRTANSSSGRPAVNDPKLRLMIPRFYSDLRNRLQDEVDKYNDTPAGPAKLVGAPLNEYRRHWISNIDEGLKEWINMGHRVGQAFVFRPDNITFDAAFEQLRRAVEDYKARHLLPMNGAPKGLGMVLSVALELKRQIVSALGITALEARMQEIEKELLDYVVRQAFGMSIDRFKEITKNPGNALDAAFRDAPRQPGEPVLTVRRVNREVLKIDDDDQSGGLKFRIEDVPAAYNTLVMSKLILLSQRQINQVTYDIRRHIARESAIAKIQEQAAQRRKQQTQRTTPTQTTRTTRTTRTQPTTPTQTTRTQSTRTMQAVQAAQTQRTRMVQTLSTVRTRGGLELDQPNIMLGFIESLDGSEQWADGDGMVLARDTDVFFTIFKPQVIGPR